MRIESIQAAVNKALEPSGAMWLAEARSQIAADPAALARLFPAVGRKCGRGQLWTDDPELIGWTVDDAVRTLLLIGAGIADVTAVYNYGDAAERRAVLRALPLLKIGDSGLPLVQDALRTNDTRLIAAALGPYSATHLPIDAWRQAVLKCVFLGIPLAWVADLDRRRDAELVRMMRAFADERRAAGRPVPPDLLMIVPELRAEEG
ncbi:MAG TPA: EboA domain-containing protein [Actinophytocola sp.]|uniref:EboA domain-containing protein n=1 Tax=Actinophytocola sp. TaxID=1872138 RepID=UPI002DBEF9AF|nr:EboA domain-containing protein [Actinophytocola sp.]HEU5472439.1 EboA domain-containing protein [Actinophytocola sp.]